MKAAPEVLPRRPLGRSGLQAAPIGLGCVTFGREIDEAAAGEVLERALACGIDLLDTAESYGGGASEAVLGRLLQRPGWRQRVTVCTKVRDNLSREHVIRSAEESLRRLRTDVLDLFLLHRFDAGRPLADPLEALDHLVRAGKVRRVGCSNFTGAQIEAALALQRARGLASFAVVQPMYSLVARQIEADLLPVCRTQGLGVMSYSPLGAGFLTGKYRPGGGLPSGTRFELKPGHRNHYFYPRSFEFLDVLRQVSEEAGCDRLELALAWVLSRPDIGTMLIGARRPEHVDQACRAWQRRQELTPALDRLTELSQEFVRPAEAGSLLV